MRGPRLRGVRGRLKCHSLPARDDGGRCLRVVLSVRGCVLQKIKKVFSQLDAHLCPSRVGIAYVIPCPRLRGDGDAAWR